MITSLPSIAILIDCWKPSHPRIINNITRFLDSTESITTVILATYSCKTERDDSDSIWSDNARLLFNNTKRKKIIDLKWAFDTLYTHYNDFKLEQTDPIIWNYRNPAKYQISMHWLWQLEYYLSLHPEIKNIYFFGAAWEDCVRYRSLGYESISNEIPNLNILTNSKCIISKFKIEHINLEDDPEWKRIDGNVYHYHPISCSI